MGRSVAQPRSWHNDLGSQDRYAKTGKGQERERRSEASIWSRSHGTRDNGLVSAFRSSVQGYQTPPGSAPPLARFTNYE